jgi:hypothetical protein
VEVDLLDPLRGHCTYGGMSGGKAFGNCPTALWTARILACGLSAPAMLRGIDGEVGLTADRFPSALDLRLSVRRQARRLVGPHAVQQATVCLRLGLRGIELCLQLI